MDRLQRAGRLLELALTPMEGQEMGTRFGEYTLVERIGEGSTCAVYRATPCSGQGGDVALKVMRDADRATEAQLSYFRLGALAAAPLEHPHIVRVLDVGEHEGIPYFTMRLVEGGTLADSMNKRLLPPAQAAAMLAKIARAVHHAHGHERGVIHRDLKPANILIDENGEPYVTDFGLARRIDRRASVIEQSNVVAYTVDYMSPEQAEGDVLKLTFATDIYSLGVIFYELLTGQVPYSGPSPFAVFQQLSDPRPVPPPRETAPGVDRRFEDICLKCLDKNPQRRYPSAQHLADDLERVCANHRPRAHRSPRVRAIDSIRRHPQLSAIISGGALLVLALAVLALLDWRTQERVRRSVLANNAFIAGSQAGAMLAQFRDYADRVERMALKESAVRDYLERGRVTDPAPLLRPLTLGFDGVFVMNAKGYIQAQWPSPVPEVFTRTFAFRDYFRGAKILAEKGGSGVYVSRAFQSESYGKLEFAFSAPLLDGNGEFQGLIVATLRANPAVGAVRMEVSDDGGRITTGLIGPRGNDRAEGPVFAPRSDLTFLVHPGLQAGAEYPMDNPGPAALQAAFGEPAVPGEQLVFRYVPARKEADFHDPLPGFEGGWLAAFAPVGRTGFIVLVERQVDPGVLARLLHAQATTTARAAFAVGGSLLVAASFAWLLLHAAAAVIGRRWLGS